MDEEKFTELDSDNLENSVAIKKIIMISHNGDIKELEVDEGILIICDTKEGHMLSYMQGGLQYAAHCLNVHMSMMIKPFLPEVEMNSLYELIQPLRDKVLDKLAGIALLSKDLQKAADTNPRQFERRVREYNDKSN